MQRVLLLMTTTTYKAQSFLQAAERLGVAVVVGSDRRQALQSLNPGGHLTLDFDDTEAAARRIVEFASQERLDAIVAADDDGALIAALASRQLNLPHASVEGVTAARDKLLTRSQQQSAAMLVPHFTTCSFDDDPEAVAAALGEDAFPCVLKPLHLSASRGVIRADDRSQFVTAFRRIGAILSQRDAAAAGDVARTILVERFIPGFEVALEGLVTEGRLQVFALFDKPDPLDGPFFEETIYVTPSRHPAAVQDALVRTAQRGLEAIGLRHGPVHAELRYNEAGAWLLEVAPRSIGGLCSRALRFSGGASLEEILLRHALGQDVSDVEREKQASGVMMIPIPRAGILRAVGGQDRAARVPGIDALRITIPIGQHVTPPPEGSRYLGFLFARAAAPEQAEAALREAHAALRIEIEYNAQA